jgi:phosphoribosylformylglycinamidine synthase
MEPFEILLSESQERMLVVVRKGQEAVVEAIFAKWDLHAVAIGTVTEGPMLRYFMDGTLVAEVPAETLVLGGGAPVYEREYREPDWFAGQAQWTADTIPVPSLEEAVEMAEALIQSPNIASKRWITEQYDGTVGTVNCTTNRPADAGVVRVRGTNKALALTVDCNARYVEADPFQGAAIAVAEAARNISCTGAVPSAITNCLNFGNPYNPEVYWQFVRAIEGMGAACRALGTPVTGGNVSFYNQSTLSDGSSKAVFPTPTIGMVGVMADLKQQMSLDFKEKGELIFLLGDVKPCIASSEYLVRMHGVKRSPAPHFDLDAELKVQACVREAIHRFTVQAVHDVSEGGLFAALLEMGMPRGLGFDIETDSGIRLDAFLFGEGQGRVVVSCTEAQQDMFLDVVEAHGVPVVLLGHVTKGKLQVDGVGFGTCEDLRNTYENAIAEEMEA